MEQRFMQLKGNNEKAPQNNSTAQFSQGIEELEAEARLEALQAIEKSQPQELRTAEEVVEHQKSSHNHNVMQEPLSSSVLLHSLSSEGIEPEAELLKAKHKLTLLRTENQQLQQETEDLRALLRSQQERIAFLEAVSKQLESANAETQTVLEHSQSDKQELLRLTEENQHFREELVLQQSKLKKLEGKRAMAKRELLRLTQQLQEPNMARDTNAPEQHSLKLVSPSEHKAMCFLKGQVNTLYKDLMDLMLSATTLKAVDSSIHYQLSASAFSLFEKEFKRLMMNIHEAAENPALIEPPEGWVSRFTSLMRIQPATLASCMGRPHLRHNFY